MEGDHTRLWVPGHRDRGDISTSEAERAALNISSGVSEFPEVTQRPEHRQWKQCKDDWADMRCGGQDIARNEMSQVGESHIGVLRATLLNVSSVGIKTYFRFVVHNIPEKTSIIDHEHR